MEAAELLRRALALKTLVGRALATAQRVGQIVSADAAELAAIDAELDAEIARLEPLAHAKLRGD